MKSCLVTLIETFTTGGIIFFRSEGYFIGNVSFEGNHAVENGGKGRLETLIQNCKKREPSSRHFSIRYCFTSTIG